MEEVQSDSAFLKGNFIGLHRTDETSALQRNHPKAFLLLCLIARRARYTRDPCKVTGLKYRQAYIGDFREAGLKTIGEYRNAKTRLEELGLCAFKGVKVGANRGTTATLLPQRIFSIDKTGTTNGATIQQPSSDDPTTIQQPQRTKKQINKETKKQISGCESSFYDNGAVDSDAKSHPSESEFIEYLVSEMHQINSDWCRNRATKAARLQYETFVGNGWRDGNGKPINDWKSKAKNTLLYKKPEYYGPQETPMRILK